MVQCYSQAVAGRTRSIRLRILFRYCLTVFRNSALYNFDGETKITNVNIGGINEIKYPIR